MEPAAKRRKVSNLLVRGLLFGVFILLLPFVYVVTIHSSNCSSSDFCLFSAPGAAVYGGGGGAESRNAAAYYSSVFSDLVAEGFLSPGYKTLCVDTPDGEEVLALRGIGVADSIGIARKKSPPLVLGGDLFNQPFASAEFDFVFAGRSLDRSKRPLDLASEIARTVKPEGFLVIHTSSAGDHHSIRSLQDLFPGFRSLRFREINGPDSSSILRQIVFQKEFSLDNSHHSYSGNSTNKCSIPDHKLHILQSAEALIEEEPLKPWITLKRNVKNIKYLPSLVDISFKRKYVYVDVGARSYGSSIGSWFKKQYPKQNQTFEIYAIEADRAFHDEYASKKGVHLLPFAAWVRNESLTFEINRHPDHKDDTEGRGMGRIRPIGGSSGRVSSGDVHTIRGFDFAQWLKRTVSDRDYVVMKMDIEGTEFDLVPRLFETGAICLIDELFLECHYNRWQKCCPGERSPKYQNTYGDCLKLFTSLRESGVLVHQWW
ncbi:uncharacterized protein [Typha angustifolia]|uniref:uncharacterized protein n=1 Tax=Typha angustifolia TaxID=59011 RepID=UPI003C30ADBD